MEARQMLEDVRNVLAEQKFQVKIVGPEVLLHHKNTTITIQPCNMDGQGMIARLLVLNVSNHGDMGALYNKAIQKYSYDSSFDQWNSSSLNLTLLPNQPDGPKRCLLWLKFDTYEDLRVNLVKETLQGWLETLRIFEEYLLKENKTV